MTGLHDDLSSLVFDLVEFLDDEQRSVFNPLVIKRYDEFLTSG